MCARMQTHFVNEMVSFESMQQKLKNVISSGKVSTCRNVITQSSVVWDRILMVESYIRSGYITYAIFISFWSLPSYSHCCLLTQVSDQDLEVLYVEANTFMLASHLFWALWALIQVSLLRAMCFNIKKQEYLTFIFCCLQAKMSPIDFDYLGYFFLRYNEYKKQKEMCVSLAQSYLSRSGRGGHCC